MEKLTLDDRWKLEKERSGSSPRGWRRSYDASQPLTPERSRSSGDASDSEVSLDRAAVNDRSETHSHIDEYDLGSRHYGALPRQSVAVNAPRSPPYQPATMSRPSLPSFKTFLGESMSSMSSPPKTPSPRGHHAQPLPQEPSYTTSTYKPPALYPSKRQKTDAISAQHTAFGPATTSPPSPRAIEQQASERIARHDTGFLPPPTAPNHATASRRSSAFGPGITSATSSPPYSYVHGTPNVRAMSNRSSIDNSHGLFHPMQIPSMTPGDALPFRFDARADDRDRRDACDRDEYHDPSRPDLRRASTSTHAPYSFHNRDTRESHNSMARHIPYPGGDFRVSGFDPYASKRSDSLLPPIRTGRDPHMTGSSTIFMPTPYEVQSGKSRKRSNLPKQATETMKVWFEQHLNSPYPSEEQKQQFANSTGISLTQVSNWFINHRRRNPELRDRRERGRNDLRIVEVSGRDRKYSL